jgi:hypothetical protein
LAVQHHIGAEQLIRILASSVILDAYPSSGHSKFPLWCRTSACKTDERQSFVQSTSSTLSMLPRSAVL